MIKYDKDINRFYEPIKPFKPTLVKINNNKPIINQFNRLNRIKILIEGEIND